MMQSVALTDSCQHEEDFVIVEAQDSDVDDDVYEESYDYCEDAFSVPSVVHSIALDSHSLQTFQEDFLDYPLPLNLNEASKEAEPSFARKVQKPAGFSMWPFGDVNNSFNEADNESVVASEISASEVSISTQDVANVEGYCHQPSDSSPSSASSRASGITGDESSASSKAATTKSEEHRGGASSYSSSDKGPPITPLKCCQAAVSSSTPTTDDASVLSITTDKPGRISNKKRRKKVKSAKKAAAAAAAAAALSQMSGLTVRSPNRSCRASKKTTRKLTGRASNKKQVACATQTLASYREALTRNSKTVG